MHKKNFKPTKTQLKKMQRLNLPTPSPKLSEAQYAKLQKQWYDKLAKQGFEDIEWVDHRTGKGHNSGFLRGSLVGGKAYHPGRDLYYQLASNYLLHCSNLKNKPYDKFIWRLHSEGLTYDEVLEHVKAKYRNAPSKYTLYYQLKHIAKLCYAWNRRHPEGLFVKRAEDRQAAAENGLADFYATEYNWLINEQYAAQERHHARRKKKNFR